MKTARARQTAECDRTTDGKRQWAKEVEIDDEHANAASKDDQDTKEKRLLAREEVSDE